MLINSENAQDIDIIQTNDLLILEYLMADIFSTGIVLRWDEYIESKTYTNL